MLACADEVERAADRDPPAQLTVFERGVEVAGGEAGHARPEARGQRLPGLSLHRPDRLDDLHEGQVEALDQPLSGEQGAVQCAVREPHAATKSRIARAVSAGRSSWGAWPAPAITRASPFGSSAAIRRAAST